jgi:hypothetical protein
MIVTVAAPIYASLRVARIRLARRRPSHRQAPRREASMTFCLYFAINGLLISTMPIISENKEKRPQSTPSLLRFHPNGDGRKCQQMSGSQKTRRNDCIYFTA